MAADLDAVPKVTPAVTLPGRAAYDGIGRTRVDAQRARHIRDQCDLSVWRVANNYTSPVTFSSSGSIRCPVTAFISSLDD